MEIYDVLFLLAAFFSEMIGTMAGFGSSTIFLPISLFFVDFKTAIILVAIFHLFGNIGRITFFKHGLDKKLVFLFGVPSVLLGLLGAMLVGMLPQPVLKMILGVFLIAISASFLARPKMSIPTNNKITIAGGSISGFITGIVGTGGALRATFLTGFGLEKTKYIATAATIALATDITRIPVYASQGFLSEEFYYYIPILFVMALAGSFVGKKIISKINQEKFKKIVLIAIILVSIKFVVDGIIS